MSRGEHPFDEMRRTGVRPPPLMAKKANLFGGSEDPNRGKYCTPEAWAGYVGHWDLDAFTNSRSHISATVHCMLDERGDDGFGRERGGKRLAGEYYARKTTPRSPLGKGEVARTRNVLAIAAEWTRVWIQPDYQFVDEALTHYGHTRFCALLKFDTRTKWFRRLTNLIRKRRGLIACPLGTFNFEPPPGVPTSSNVFPHALYYADARDVTDAVLRRSIAWRP